MRQHTIVSKSSRAGNGKHQSVAAASAIILLSLFTVVGVISVNRRYRSEEHTSELQSQSNLVCRLLLEKKKKIIRYNENSTHLKGRHTRFSNALTYLLTNRYLTTPPNISHGAERKRNPTCDCVTVMIYP